jgi:WD40 repeat protein/transcriptional regulator with XRE-family HTH domain
MKRSFYGEADYAFGQAMLNLRTSIGLTQTSLAELLGVSRKAVGKWEAGGSYPKASHLKAVLAFAFRQRAFAPGREEEQIRAFWQAAHQKVLLDEQWLSTLLSSSPPSPALVAPRPSVPAQPEVPVREALGPRVEWGEALDMPSFYGREQELAAISRWVVEEGCRLVSVLGMGGIGKSALVVHAMQRLAEHFDVVLFRSLRNTPDCSALLESCLQVLSPEALARLSQGLEPRLNLLLKELRTSRVLLVLDDLEVLLSEGDVRGRLRPGYEGYGRLLRQVAQTGHQSCLLLTSREKPAELRPLEGSRTLVHALHLGGLGAAAGEQLLAEHEVRGSSQERARLVEAYSGHPLALQIVAETIVDLFGGAIDPFLSGGTTIFGSIAELLEKQWGRLSSLEQTVLSWLAIMREPVTLGDLLAVLVVPLPRVQVLEAVDGLRRRSLIERGQRAGSFTLQSVVLEDVTSRLVTTASQEIGQRQLVRLIQHGLSQAGAKEYVRQTQERLLLAPLLSSLQSVYQGRAEVERQLRALLDALRERAQEAQGYGPANLVTLLRLLRGDLRDLDLSRLVLRDVHLQGVEMQDASLAGATLLDTVFTEAFNAARSVAISRNGEYWAAGSWRGEVRVWQQGGQSLHLAWQAHTDTTSTLAFSPDERLLATGSWDGTIKVWDLERGALLWTSWQTDSIQSLAFAPDGRMLASGGDDAIVRLWDVTSGKNLQMLLGPPSPVYAVAWSPDGSLLASGGFDGRIRLWQMQGTQSAMCVQTLAGHTNWVLGLAFAPDSTQLASGSLDRTVKLWDVASGRVRQTLTGHTDRVRAVAWSPDGRTVASGGFDETIWLWGGERGNSRTALHGHTAAVYAIAFTPDSKSLLSSSEDGTLRVWEVESRQCVRILRGYAVSLYDMAWSPDGTQLASAGSDTLVTIWDGIGRGGGTPPRMLRGHRWNVRGVAWSPDGRLLASSGTGNAIELWDSTTGASVHTLRDPDSPDTIFLGIAWSPDGRLLASGSHLHGVQVWDVAARIRRWVGHAHPTRIRRVAWSRDGTRLASCGDDGSVCLWEASDGALLQKLQGHNGLVASVAWSPDGTRLASSGGGRGELFVWDAHSGERLQALSGHPGSVFAVDWSQLGDLLVSGGSDGMLRWWDVQRGECVMMREAHQGAVQSLRISSDGRMLASCGDDSTIKVWDLENGEHLRTLRRDRPYERLNITGTRGLTQAQKATLRALGAVEENETGVLD